MNKKNLLYFTRTMGLGGTEKVVLQLCEIMKGDVNKIIVCSCGGVNVEKLKELGIKHYYIPDIEKKGLKTIVTVIKILREIIKNEDIDIIHTHHRMAAFYAKIIKFKNKLIYIHNSHNTFYDKKLLTKLALKNVNVVAVGKKVKDNLCDYYGIAEEKVDVIYNGIESFNKTVLELDILKEYKNKGYFLVGNIGRLSEQKGMKYFVEAIPKILKSNAKIKFFIVGDGEDREELETLVKSMNLSNDVFLLGYRNDIQNIISQLDLIVLSSLWEGLPLTPIEAFSVGKTIIATAVDGTVEIIDDNINGILISPRSSDEIADNIIKLYENPDKIREMEEKAIVKFYEIFSYDKLKECYRAYYKKVLE